MQRTDVMRAFSGVAEATATSAAQIIVEADPRQRASLMHNHHEHHGNASVS
jgi:hypothetical protein